MNAWLVDGATDAQALRELATLFAEGHFDADRLVFVTSPASLFHDEVLSAAGELGLEGSSIGDYQVFEVK